MMSRGGKPIAGAEHILESLQWFFDRFPDAELDGELYNHSFKDNFDTLISYIKKKRPESREFVQYHIYDVPSHPGTFSERWQFILNEIEQYLDNEPIVIVETHYVSSKEALDVYYDLFLDEGYEGQMIRLDTVYENKRTKALLKRKEFKDDEFPLVSINEGIGNWSGMAKSVTFRLPDGRTANAGIKGNQAEMLALLHATQYERVTIKYQNLTPGGVPRFPVAIKFWDAEALATGDRDG
jgi:DNA ligase-1